MSRPRRSGQSSQSKKKPGKLSPSPGQSRFLRWGAAVLLVVGVVALGVAVLDSDRSDDNSPSAWGYPIPKIPANASAEYRALMEHARDEVTAALDAYPDSPDAIAALAVLNYLSQSRAGEIECWHRCLEVAPDYELAYARLVARFEERAEFDRVVNLMEPAVEADPTNISHNAYLGSALLSLNRMDEARDILERLHRRVAGNAESHFILGKAYDQLEEWERAASELETSLALEPARVDVLYSLGSVYAKLGDKEKAAEYRESSDRSTRDNLERESASRRGPYDDSILLPQFLAEILTFSGKAYWSAEDAQQAEDCFLKALAVWPEDRRSRVFLSEICASQGRLDEALRWILELRKLEPDKLVHRRNQALIYCEMSRFAEAEKVYRDICGLEPTAYNYSQLAEICARSGDWAGAGEAIEQALRLEPENPQTRQAYEAIRKKL
jgi:tetratricopeptide (TPR) repeat protein